MRNNQNNEVTTPLHYREGQGGGSAFFSFAIKEARHILRDKRTMLILFGMPVALMLIFGFAITTDVRNVRTIVVTSQLDPQTQAAVERLAASEYFTITTTVPTPKEAERLIRSQKADMSLTPDPSPKGEGSGIQWQIMVDGADPIWPSNGQRTHRLFSLNPSEVKTIHSPRPLERGWG